MDASIRQLILYSTTVDEASGVKLVVQAYNSLQQAFNKSKNNDDTDTCGSDLFVQCAEVAFKLKQVKICQECLRMYFNGTPLTNQFLCRAYLCQAQLLAPKSAENVVDFETAVVYLIKAIDFAKDKSRYHFIVYNTSVLYWQMARPFLRDGYRGTLYPSLQQIVKALELINDSDHDWRATLMIALIESYVDAGLIKEATAASQTASQFTLNSNPSKFKDVVSLQMKHKLVDPNKMTKEVIGMPNYSSYLKLQKIKLALSQKSKIDVQSELKKLVEKITGRYSSSAKSSPREQKGRGNAREMPATYNAASDDRNNPRGTNQLTRKLSASKVSVSPHEIGVSQDVERVIERLIRPYLLVDTARVCTSSDLVELAQFCLDSLKECDVTDTSLLLEVEFVECELMVKRLGDKQEAYTKSAVEMRLSAIKRMDQVLQNAVRSGNANLVEGACVTQWNLCLPLLQRNLRKHVRRPLGRIAQALEDITSLQVTLRCQVHTELARCEEAVEQIEVAVKHVNKAIQIDDSGFYHERLQLMLHRLLLSTQLYRTPDRPEDVAAVIIEQARKSSDSGSVKMKRSLLVKAGLALAPDAFQYVLDSENELKGADAFGSPNYKHRHEAKAGLKGVPTPVQLLSARALHWRKCIRKAPGHLKRLGDENDRERAQLWVDLAKAARQQQVWDVCRVASMFCLLYDDGRWKITTKDYRETGTPKDKQSKRGPRSNSGSVSAKTPVEEEISDSQLHNIDLLRMLAEVRFISGEAFIHLLRSEGLNLNEAPTAPDSKQRNKGDADNLAGDPEWAEYADWIHELNEKGTNAFLRAIELGIELRETWIVCSGAVYLWNYNNHLIADGRFTELVPTFEKILFGMQEIGHSSEATLLVRVCDVIAKGLFIPWIPKKVPADTSLITSTTAPTHEGGRKKTGGKGAPMPPIHSGQSVDPQGGEDLKKALLISEYGLQVTNGSNPADLIPTEVRHQLLATWVQVKQLLQQQISPNFGTENEKIPEQQGMTKALVMLEMLTLNQNQIMEFTLPELTEICDVVEECSWDDACVELEVWMRLAKLAHAQKNHSLVSRCCLQGLALQQIVTMKNPKAKSSAKHKRIVALKMLATTSCILGESLMSTCAVNPPARRQAMKRFVNSANYGEEGCCFELVMVACRMWWNAALPLIPSPVERELLRQPLESLLKNILHSVKYAQSQEDTELNHDGGGGGKQVTKISEEETDAAKVEKHQNSIGDPRDDRTLRAAMYGLLFQTYADKGQWEEGLVIMDRALHHMPRTKHRLLLFKHRVIVKAKLGKDASMDIAKFRDESEDYLSHMWHRVALCSRNTSEQLSAFQQAIEALHSEENLWQKIEYLLELSTWMHCHEFVMTDTLNVIEWACDILLNMKFHVEAKARTPDKGRGKRGKGSKPVSRGTPSQISSKPLSGQPSKLKSAESKDKKQNVSTPEKKEPDPPIPVGKQPKIGVVPANIDIQMEDLRSTRQLEGLVRGHVMMATICGQGSKNHVGYCLLAYGFVMRLWKNSLASAGVVMRKLPKSEGGNEADNKKKGGKGPPTATERSKRKGPPDAVPSSTSEWAVYSPPEEIKQAFLHDTGDCALNKQTITCAGLTVHHLVKLSEYLRDASFNHLSLPVLSLASVITQVILGSSTWKQLIDIKKIIVCYELHLENAAKYWETSMDHKFLTEEEQIQARQDLEMQDIQKELAKQEEQRIRNAGRRNLEDESNADSDEDHPPPINQNETGPITLTGRKVGGVNMGEIWTEKAKHLLQLGHYQVCRTLLSEALTLANYNNDSRLQAEIYHIMADLSIREGCTGQALQLIKKAQLISGDEEFWKTNIYLLIDAITLNQDPSDEDLHTVTKIIKHSTDCLTLLLDNRPTKKPILGFLISALTAHSCFIRLSFHYTKASEQLRKLEQAEAQLHRLGFHRKLASIHMKHTNILIELSKTNPRMQHSYILAAIDILKGSLCNLKNICNDVLPKETDKDVSLPVEREMVKLQLHLVSVLLHAGQVSADEERKTEAEEEAKGEMQRTIEKYVGKQNDEELESDQIWDEDRKTFVHQAFSILNTLHGNVPKNHPLRCEWMYLMGRALHLMGESTHPDPPDYQWNIYDYVSEQVLSPVEVHNSLEHIDSITSVAEQDEDQTDEEEDSFMVRQQQKRNDEAGKILHSSDMTSRLLSHASEVLAQCIHLALPMQDWVIISKAALEMVECCAQFDPATAALYLSLHQSAETSRSMKELLLKALSDPSNSQFASLVQQEAWLMKQYVTTGMHASSMRKNVLKILEETYIAWKRIQLSPNYLNLMRDLPPGLNIVILQHSPDQKMLYCAILDKTKAQAPQSESKKGKEKPVSSSTVRSRAFISRVKMDPNFYNDLTDLREDFLQRFMSFLLQNEYQVYQLEMRKRMLQQLSKNSAEPAISETALEEQEEEEAKLKEEFQSILDDMESYLAPITSQLQAKLIQPIIDQGMENINNHLTVTDSELLVLLADPALMHLPLEALKCLQTPFIDSVSRDFSLQFLHRRWFIDPDAAAAAEKKKADAKGQPKTAKGARDPGKKQGGAPSAKVVPINRDIPQGCRAVDTHGIRYVVDPHDECSETEEHRPEQVFKQLLHMYHQSFTPRWSGKFGSDGDPSTGQWEEALLAGSSFIYYGMEKFISQFPPSKLSTMDLRQCQIALLLDKSQTHTSFQHQSKVDVEKTNCLLSIEKPLETAMLLSLAGVNSVCINQWHSTTEDNASKLQKIFKFILEEGKMVGIAIRNITNPSLKKPDPPPISPEPPRSGKKLKDGGRGSRGSGRTATASKSNDGIHPSAHPVENSMDTVNEEESLNVTEEVEEEVPPFILDASHCNMILFGLPNFVVA